MPRGKKINLETRKKIAEKIMAGVPRLQVAEEFGISTHTVTNICRAVDVESPYFKGGLVSRSIKPEPKRATEEPEEDWIIVADKTIKMAGAKTGFIYTGSIRGKDLTIETGYGEPFVLDAKDLVSFANELMSVAEAIEKMRSNPWG